MTATLRIIWDYDGPVGQMNSSYPYNFDERRLFREIENVETILRLANDFSIKMTFACTGFSAEPGVYPYHICDQIRRIYAQDHEIASHSWRHEWFPFLTTSQIEKSLARSKFALETCIGVTGAVNGFVVPFSRPMSWYSRGALSLGDRVFGPWRKGASLGSLLKMVSVSGYKWARVAYRPLWEKVFPNNLKRLQVNMKWEVFKGVVMVPSHYFGFDNRAHELLNLVTNLGGDLVISAHPAALSFGREESLENLTRFLEVCANKRENNELEIITVSSGLISVAESES